jgi:hypothetical protein
LCSGFALSANPEHKDERRVILSDGGDALCNAEHKEKRWVVLSTGGDAACNVNAEYKQQGRSDPFSRPLPTMVCKMPAPNTKKNGGLTLSPDGDALCNSASG